MNIGIKKQFDPRKPFAHVDVADVQSRMQYYGMYGEYQTFPVAAEMKVNPIDEFTPAHAAAGQLAFNLIHEEVNGEGELLPSLLKWMENPTRENLVGVLDGAVDAIYVIFQLCHTLDLPLEQAFAVVHANNLHKIQLDEHGQLRKRADGKLLKPENHPVPNLWEVLEAHSNWRALETRKHGAENWKAEDVKKEDL